MGKILAIINLDFIDYSSSCIVYFIFNITFKKIVNVCI